MRDMEIIFAPRDILQINNARIVYKNFSGKPSAFNREGDRNFSLVIPNIEIADALKDKGWNIKIKPPREEGDEPFITMPVTIKFNDRGPRVYLETGNNLVRLDEESICCLDNVDIVKVDMDIRPYDWEINGKTGRTAYLQAIKVTQEVDRFCQQYAEEEYPEEF